MNGGKYFFDEAVISGGTPAQLAEAAEYMNLDTTGASNEAILAMVLQENAGRMQAADQSRLDQDAEDADGGGGTGKIVLIVVLVLAAFGAVGGIFFVMTKRNVQNQRPVMNMAAGGSAAHYANPVAQGGMPLSNMGAPSAGVPSWADPAVPFLSRGEAEAQLQQSGSTNGSFVIRQSTSNAKGYVITSCNSSKVQHIQLKRQSDGNLYYGPKLCGGNIAAAIQTLSNSVPIAPKDGPQYFLRQEAGGGGVENSDA